MTVIFCLASIISKTLAEIKNCKQVAYAGASNPSLQQIRSQAKGFVACLAEAVFALKFPRQIFGIAFWQFQSHV